MKSDSLIKATASLLVISLLATTCFTTVSEAAGKRGIIGENPVTVSALMMQSLNSKTYEVIVAEAEDKKTVEVASAGAKQAVQNQETKQNEKAVKFAKEESKDIKAKAVDQKVKKTVSKYAKAGIAIEDVVNIRKKPNTTSTIVGRLYKGGAAKIISVKGEWVGIKSGNVKGYIKKSLLAIGEDAEKIAPKYVTRYAVVNTVTLNVREKASTDAKILVQIGQDEAYKILKENKEWYQIKIDAETKGCITKEFVKVAERFATAISMEEILAQQEEDAEEETSSSSSSDSNKSNRESTNNRKNKKSSSKKSSSKKSSSSSTSTKGKSVASYALQFVGNPYVYGGSSLTNGTDCSGFTQSVYRNYGYSISRTSGSQYASAGRIVSMNELKSGDLLFYKGSSGRVNHVAIYIGGGQVVHASNPRDGIKVSRYNYRTPVRARRVMN